MAHLLARRILLDLCRVCQLVAQLGLHRGIVVLARPREVELGALDRGEPVLELRDLRGERLVLRAELCLAVQAGQDGLVELLRGPRPRPTTR